MRSFILDFFRLFFGVLFLLFVLAWIDGALQIAAYGHVYHTLTTVGARF